MSEPLSDICVYCGSPDVLDDAWWCDKLLCWLMYRKECEEEAAYERRTPLTYNKAVGDLMATKACVWGPPSLAIDQSIEKLLACIWVRRVPLII